MPYLEKLESLKQPGIVSLFEYSPETAKPLSELAEQIMRRSTLKQYVAELIAAYVSKENNCEFCYRSHVEAFKNATLDRELANKLSTSLNANTLLNDVDLWLKSLLMLANDVRLNVKASRQSIDFCKHAGVRDEEIHDTVLITSAFCMFNRYVNGLDTKPATAEQYEFMGKKLANYGYLK
jgi:AhpD family alkylhydroperoxidase